MERSLETVLVPEQILFQEIEDRDGALMLDIGAAADDRALVERQADDPGLGVAHAGLARRIATERA